MEQILCDAPPPLNSADVADWSEVADGVLANITASVMPEVRPLADRLYEELLYSVQAYLADNIKFNIGSRLDTAERERRAQWDRAEECERRALAAEERARTAEAQVAMLIKAMPPGGDESAQ